jgi:hypothetical protein
MVAGLCRRLCFSCSFSSPASCGRSNRLEKEPSISQPNHNSFKQENDERLLSFYLEMHISRDSVYLFSCAVPLYQRALFDLAKEDLF